MPAIPKATPGCSPTARCRRSQWPIARAAGERDRQDDAELSFEYKLISPLFDFQGLVTSVSTGPDAITTGVRDLHGRATATGTLRGS